MSTLKLVQEREEKKNVDHPGSTGPNNLHEVEKHGVITIGHQMSRGW